MVSGNIAHERKELDEMVEAPHSTKSFLFSNYLPVVRRLSYVNGNLLVCLLIWEDLEDDRRLLAKLSECLLEPSEEMMLPADAKDALESVESMSCSGIASESLLDISEDQRLVTLARESTDLCPIIS